MWFGVISQITALVINQELLVGPFAEHFSLGNGFWSLLIIYAQAAYYGLEIILYCVYLVSISVDYGVYANIFG